ncbi:hypothetical protein ASPZODRAFT_128774 [Penicilliopsis zonata CBS 506.65]|uniref:Uncharacterized protein n=1 Tax=Penicilliopsis zonata CBS 506.65 TaxID=1073090 RepID=A0A1L9SSS3_9EURO|nr:hypothetical protein ASPZODRAFT_128774 [Penicilliopsis zonata CBS 506.65]OJJ50157.1 hypothetical protein ASPZODRAFT_128774 [Penicilliopsis zonata CBS 506.65]
MSRRGGNSGGEENKTSSIPTRKTIPKSKPPSCTCCPLPQASSTVSLVSTHFDRNHLLAASRRPKGSLFLRRHGPVYIPNTVQEAFLQIWEALCKPLLYFEGIIGLSPRKQGRDRRKGGF